MICQKISLLAFPMKFYLLRLMLASFVNVFLFECFHYTVILECFVTLCHCSTWMILYWCRMLIHTLIPSESTDTFTHMQYADMILCMSINFRGLNNIVTCMNLSIIVEPVKRSHDTWDHVMLSPPHRKY